MRSVKDQTMKLAFAAMLVMGGATALADGWVADPYRAVDITWKKHPVKGKDFWLLFNSEMVLNRPGVSELPMVRESGTQWVNCDTSPLVQRFYRTISMSYGTDQVSWGDFFRGEAKGIRYTSKYTTAEEAKALAARRW